MLPLCGDAFVKELGPLLQQKHTDVQQKAARYAANCDSLKATALFFMGGKRNPQDQMEFTGSIVDEFITPIHTIASELAEQFSQLDKAADTAAADETKAAQAAKKAAPQAAAVQSRAAGAGVVPVGVGAGDALHQALLADTAATDRPLRRRGRQSPGIANLPAGPMADLLSAVQAPRTMRTSRQNSAQ